MPPTVVIIFQSFGNIDGLIELMLILATDAYTKK